MIIENNQESLNVIAPTENTSKSAGETLALRTVDTARDIKNELSLELIGVIAHDTVWDYISRVKKITKLQVFVIQMTAETVNDQTVYDSIYLELTTRNRFGVMKASSRLIKDFYLLPYSHRTIWPVWFNDLEFSNTCSNFLIGIIVMRLAASPPLREAVKRHAAIRPASERPTKVTLFSLN